MPADDPDQRRQMIRIPAVQISCTANLSTPTDRKLPSGYVREIVMSRHAAKTVAANESYRMVTR